MAKKRGITAKKLQNKPTTTLSCNNQLSLRQETTGKIHSKAGAGNGFGSRNSKSFLKLEHLRNLAVWASGGEGGEASIPSLAAFFGRQFAAAGEALGVPPNPSLFACQRCETILQPGFNCTVRIEKTRAKASRRHKKPNTLTKNTVVYNCHFCSHRNQRRGTPKGHMKEICPPKPFAKSEPAESMIENSARLEEDRISKEEVIKIDEIALPVISEDTAIANSPTTPAVKSGMTLLDAKRRKRNRSGSKKPQGSESNSVAIDAEKTTSASSKRKRKSWTSLKEIAESNEHESSRNITNLTIPFFV